MTCLNCQAFETEILIKTPGILKRVVAKIQDAVQSGKLEYNSFESSRELIGQVDFRELDLSSGFPDVLRYHFNCPECGSNFMLHCETYHGSGGKWLITRSKP